MQNLTCPVPSNINPLTSNGFMFSINKYPDISFFCQEANIPDLTLPSADADNPFVVVPIPGEKLSFGDLQIQFLIDENMANYLALHNWMIGLGFPKSRTQYANFINSHTDVMNTNPNTAAYSNATLQVLTNSNNSSQIITFVDLFPVSLASVQLQSNQSDVIYIAGSATFKYTYYTFEI